MVRLAPHLVKPLPMIVPAFDGERPDRKLGVGLNLYDVMAVDKLRGRRKRGEDEDDQFGGDWAPERHRMIEGAEVVERAPALAPRNPTGGYLFYDCQTDDSRLVLTALEEAERFGAICANRLEATGLVEKNGRARGVKVRDVESGSEFEIGADNVVNATGVWADRLRPEELLDEGDLPVIRPSRGTHITIASAKLPLNDGVIVPAGEGRSIFALPWLGSTLIGTTDNDYDETDLDHVSPAAADIEYLLNATNEFFAADFDASDVSGAFAGVRPLIATGDPKKSVDISRRAELYETASGMITITGGKLTTWRRMAKMAVDRIVERDSREAPCRTEEIPLGQAIRADDLPRVEGVPEEAYEQLAGRYGYRARDVLAVAAERGELAQPIVVGGPTDLLAEVVFAARNEQARSVGDALLRRSRVALLAAREVTGEDDAVARRVAQAMATELDWDEARIEAEVESFSAEAAAEGIVANVAPTA
jgi:glycerol-3-phosphate dehydrogenase